MVFRKSRRNRNNKNNRKKSRKNYRGGVANCTCCGSPNVTITDIYQHYSWTCNTCGMSSQYELDEFCTPEKKALYQPPPPAPPVVKKRTWDEWISDAADYATATNPRSRKNVKANSFYVNNPPPHR